MEKKVTSHITKGLVIALILFVLDIIAGFAHFKFATWWRWIPSIYITCCDHLGMPEFCSAEKS